jgi:hypothetical protein
LPEGAARESAQSKAFLLGNKRTCDARRFVEATLSIQILLTRSLKMLAFPLRRISFRSFQKSGALTKKALQQY